MDTSSIWTEINVDSEKYLVKHVRQNEMYVIHLTNLVNIWTEELLTSCLIQRCRNQNPLIEADDESLIQHIFKLLESRREDVIFKSSVNGDNRTLDVKTKLAGIPFNFTFNLKKMNPEILCQEVTQPLLLLAQQLFTHQSTLCKLLEAKDAEISEYKAEGAQLKRRKLQTETFNRNELIGYPILPASMITSSLTVIDLSPEIRKHSTKSTSNVDMKSTDIPLIGTQEIPANIQNFPAEIQETQLSPSSVKIKEEFNSQTESRNAKKRKQVNRPKLRL